ncbi:hypothetical protein LTR78_001454 [Recurvomyces mirabilis]|uniref:C2H2-type domain-containing protein n=1 Tax=Recurvomyces mirabilis TaxID=574656 RepID=A0AAE0WVN3_9PEZI|nr:hypothetical protein LTR78_001454 [Recurvomyces mirabilis]KAK5161431.1 hypothetical protein LTS14_001227 [Recurvomyces mirabilis]
MSTRYYTSSQSGPGYYATNGYATPAPSPPSYASPSAYQAYQPSTEAPQSYSRQANQQQQQYQSRPKHDPKYSHSPPSRQPSQCSSGAAQYICMYDSCRHEGYCRYADLQRHVDVIHNTSTLNRFNCIVEGCHRVGIYGFTRKDKMVDHLREVHKCDIPKRVNGGGVGSRRSSGSSS